MYQRLAIVVLVLAGAVSLAPADTPTSRPASRPANAAPAVAYHQPNLPGMIDTPIAVPQERYFDDYDWSQHLQPGQNFSAERNRYYSQAPVWYGCYGYWGIPFGGGFGSYVPTTGNCSGVPY